MNWKNQLTKTPYLVLFIILITVGVGTASALITITLAGNVNITGDADIDGSLNVDGPITGQTITNLEDKIDSICGSNSIGGSEQCDGIDLNGQSCSDFALIDGTLQCDTSCNFDFSLCLIP
jgi:hypothetical protein